MSFSGAGLESTATSQLTIGNHRAPYFAHDGEMVRLFLTSSAVLLGRRISLAQDRLADSTVFRNDYVRPDLIPFPPGNPYSKAKADLGQKLFFDPMLSGSRAQSCASCHQASLARSDGLPPAIGDNHLQITRRSPTLLNFAWLARLGWRGQFTDIESVGFSAITGTANMNLAESDAIGRLAESADYTAAFSEAFDTNGITQETVEAALATFERTIVSGDAPFDRWINGNDSAVDEAAKRGFVLFNGAAGCSACHSGWAFTDGLFHDIGVERSKPGHRKSFKTPTLRDVDKRPPYMHDGSVPTLGAVISLYDRGGAGLANRSVLTHALGLTEEQKADLAAFLHTLTSDSPFADKPALPHQ